MPEESGLERDKFFFMYKRLNKMIPGASGVLIPTDEKTILPVPATETNLNK